MRDIIKYSASLLLACLALSGCQKFTEPEPYQFADMEPTMTLADFKALYTGSPTEITDASIVLEGKIISSDRSGNVYRTLYIEDSTAGLEVKIGKTGLYNDYKLGQTLYVKPQGLYLGTYGGSVQLGARSYEDRYETSWIDVQALIDRTIFRGEFGEPLPPTGHIRAAQTVCGRGRSAMIRIPAVKQLTGSRISVSVTRQWSCVPADMRPSLILL